jgi:hypothetical protein
MLLDLLKSLVRRPVRDRPLSDDEYPVVRQQRIKHAHQRAPINSHLDILYRDLRIGGHGLNELVAQCTAQSGTEVLPLKALQRPLASYFLARYFLHARAIEGAQAECGVFQGASALVLCRAAQTDDPAYAGAGLHLIDSFAGLSRPGETDSFSLPGPEGRPPSRQSLPEGTLSASLEEVRLALRGFPQVAFHRGWIPDAFALLPESRWSFVHIDVDLHDPTYTSLDYFFPRLSTGGVIICDDYGSAVFPGARRAWDRYCDELSLPFVVLDTGQSVILKT